MKTLGIENPTVATLSNGIEAGKGSDVIKEAHELLENVVLISQVILKAKKC